MRMVAITNRARWQITSGRTWRHACGCATHVPPTQTGRPRDSDGAARTTAGRGRAPRIGSGWGAMIPRGKRASSRSRGPCTRRRAPVKQASPLASRPISGRPASRSAGSKPTTSFCSDSATPRLVDDSRFFRSARRRHGAAACLVIFPVPARATGRSLADLRTRPCPGRRRPSSTLPGRAFSSHEISPRTTVAGCAAGVRLRRRVWRMCLEPSYDLLFVDD